MFGATVRSVLGGEFASTLDAARCGDEDAFAALFRDVQPVLLRYLRVAAGPDGEDLASETWVRVARGLERFRGDEEHFRAWLFTIARHRALDWRRQQARHPAALRLGDDLTDRPAPDDPSGAVLETLSTDGALALIRQLPPDQAEVVVLRAVVGMDVPSAARIVGKRPGTVRVLAHRGLQRLAQLLDGAGRHRGRDSVTP